MLAALTSGLAAAQNDECAGALTLALGATPFDTTMATSSAPAWPCAGLGGADLWYTFTPSAPGSLVTIDTCGSSYDSALEVFSGTCGALTSLACNDDFCILQSSLSFLSTGNTVYLRVGGFNASTGAGNLNVTEVLPNDECATPLPIAAGATPFSNVSATTSLETLGCGAPGPDLWYAYTSTGAGNQVTIQTCGATFDTVLEAYTGTCGMLAAVACNDDSCGLQSAIGFATPSAGTTYLVRLAGWNGSTGSGVITLTEAPPPPMFDLAIVDCLPGAFIDISATGTPLNLSDDAEVNITTTVSNALFAAGTARVGSNGGVRFGGAGTDLGITNAALPTSGAFGLTSQAVLPFWDDFNTAAGTAGNIYWQELGGTLIVQWQNAAFFGSTDRATFQVQIPSSGPAYAQFLYTDIESVRATSNTCSTIGYQSGGVAGNTVQYSFNAPRSVRNGTVLSLINRITATTFMSSTVPGTWVDIAATGTPLNLNDDASVDINTTIGNGMFPAGVVRVGSNGAIRFGGAGTSLAFTNAAIPASGAYSLTSQVAMPFWDDFNTAGGTLGNIYWQEVGGKLIVQWNQARFFGSSTEQATFQVQIPRGGPVVAQYLYQDVQGVRANGGGSATIGYQSGGLVGNNVQWSFNTAGAVSNGTVLSICYANATAGTRYCAPVANSTGVPGDLYGTGTTSLAADNLVLNVANLPANSFGFFIRGTAAINVLMSGGSQGTLCVGGTIARGVGGAIFNSGATGTASLPAMLNALPTTTVGSTVPATVGQTIWLQCWYRDLVGGSATANLTNGLQVQVTP